MMSPDILEIERRAESGDADAQYAFAAIWSQRQQGVRARLWLERAAAQGHADALFTLASALLTTTEGSAGQRENVVAALNEARAKGSVSALRILAALTAAGLVGGDGWDGAFLMMREACEKREPAAMREVAALLLDEDAGDADAESLLREAAARDSLAAALISRRRGRGHSESGSPYSLDRVFSRLRAPHEKGEAAEICANPRVVKIESAFGKDLCDHLIGAALPRLKREHVLGADGKRRVDPHRTAWGALLGFGFADLPAVFAGQRLALLAGIPYAHAEPLSILRYMPGQEYRPHYDFLSRNDPDLAAHGQRLKTGLIYLNEGYEGGETRFLKPDIRFKGKAGDALIFNNVGAGGAPDDAALHAGLPIVKGEKWLGSLWLRDRPFSG